MARTSDLSLIKKSHVKTPMTQEQLDQLIRSHSDPLYFMETFMWIQTDNGRELFKAWDYQIEILNTFHGYRNSIALTARQMGKTTCAAGYLLWKAMFTPDTTILICANVLKQALEIMNRVRFAYEELPDFVRAGVTSYNKGSIEFDNGSRIVSTATTQNSGRGMTVNVLYCDEFAFVQPNIAKDFWTSVRPTLGKMGKCIITSTPNNDEDQFSQIWKDATKTLDETGNEIPGGVGKNNFKAIKVTWERRPDRDERWATNEIATIGLSRFRREFECEFLTEDEVLIDNQVLERLEGRNEIAKTNDIRWYVEPEPNKTYILGLDPSTGTGGDPAAIEVYQLPEMVQVAEWQDNNTPVVGQLRILLQILRYIDQTLRGSKEQRGAPEIYWTIENNGMGEATLQTIEDTGEEMFPGIFVHEPKRRGRIGSRRKGMSTTNKSKIAACSKFKSLVESGRIEIYSRALIRELKFYVRAGEGFSAKWGETDNLISATLLIVRVMMILQDWDPNLTEYLKDDAGSDDDAPIAPLPVLI